MLAHVVLNHVPVVNYCFRNKCVYITHIVRRVLKTVIDRSLLDDKVGLSDLFSCTLRHYTPMLFFIVFVVCDVAFLLPYSHSYS
jgi:hypothetical protein